MAKVTSAPKLTYRQMQVLGLVADGLSNKEIARQLGLSENTVKIHVSRVFRALDVGNRTQAALVARRRGILPAKRQGAASAAAIGREAPD